MNLQGYPPVNVPLQMVRCDGPSVAQYYTVNVNTEPPKDHIIWSLFCFVYSNPFCLGLTALIFSIKARDRKLAGDLNGARRYASTACCLNIWATVLGSLMMIVIIITIIVLVVQENDTDYYMGPNNNYNSNYNSRW
ncbi:dispanin subfamily A member 2b-like [Anabas testudineus]|uniref:Uncharacterized protein n=2 Tax=Anabas testudineus TaxID=64144 RepID=A0AAQ6IF22_ANATE|nr:dispanin subfamily A member 2b-like [Anabas testudineus]